MAIAASIMLWCATPQQAATDTYEKHEIASVQQQKVKTTGTVGSGPERRSHDRCIRQSKRQCYHGCHY